MSTESAASHSPRITPVHPQWAQDLVLRDAPPSGKADGWDELNHLDEVYLEFSTASNIPRGLILWGGIACLAAGLGLSYLMLGFSTWDGIAGWIVGVAIVMWLVAFSHGIFFLRLDLRLPKDRPVRFNRRQGKVYANSYTWNHNPFGRWGGGVKVFDWSTLQAEITKQIGASGEVVTQRYALELVACKPGSFEEVDRFRLQHGAQTTRQYEEQWELLRRYMNDGPEGLPPQNLRNQTPGFIDCLLFAMPWFAPTEMGRRARERMRGFFGTLMMVLMSLAFPLWLLFGLGNFVVMHLAPEASWPPGVDEASKLRSSGSAS
ncbi:type IV secretory pathway TrbD component [Variovorax boronicumulans]|uniref:DUF6708 domain-containing protein n=1 Tax=Variovorax boronicumulans TaxID=436515 RepID=UPI00278A9218|nr:DUF6708 domain-containing protein [Variovorax boronicumulans]MDP9994669.1 type IV secretory pathway TrbD component [Variovorax boronicumulans]MDQ0005989.1 type IV secretory pathway TrbD component [Variovorax boronicumulans]MDQ0044762.1 type IV secretory pathway TrbD component [Variovorax boronicumulans]